VKVEKTTRQMERSTSFRSPRLQSLLYSAAGYFGIRLLPAWVRLVSIVSLRSPVVDFSEYRLSTISVVRRTSGHPEVPNALDMKYQL